ncbi:MAG: hypothetical protein ACOC95_05255 [Planctomycetota bacterium]
MSKALSFIAVAVVLAAGPRLAVAQIERINRAPIGTWTTPDRSLGNLTVTGQVSGGFSFRGRVPYAGANELRLQLPTETIDTFRRDAMSLDRVRRGDLYGPRPYTPPTRATYMLRQAAQSPYAFDPITGSVDVSGAGGTILQRPERSEMIRDYAFTPILSQEDLAQVVSQSDPSDFTPASEAPLSAVIPVEQDRPGASALFGMIQETQRRRLAESVLDLETLEDEDAEPPEAETDEAEIDDGAADTPADEGTAEMPRRPKNAFADLLAKLSQVGPDVSRPTDLRPGAKPPSDSLEQLDTDPSSRVRGRRATGALAGALSANVVVRDLAGTGGGLFNRYMAQGDELLRAGRFYRAASAYDRAQLIHTFNPLASLGAGLAYLGAGESHRASFQLRRSVRLLPDLVRVRVDVDNLVGADVIDRRVAELHNQVGETVEPVDMPHVFLLTFIYANRGDLDEAHRWAAELVPLADEGDNRLRDYATAVLGPEPTGGAADAAP